MNADESRLDLLFEKPASKIEAGFCVVNRNPRAASAAPPPDGGGGHHPTDTFGVIKQRLYAAPRLHLMGQGELSAKLTEGIRKRFAKRNLINLENNLNPTVFCFAKSTSPWSHQGEALCCPRERKRGLAKDSAAIMKFYFSSSQTEKPPKSD